MKKLLFSLSVLCMLTACSKEQNADSPGSSPVPKKFEVGVEYTYRSLIASDKTSVFKIKLGTDRILDIKSSTETPSAGDEPFTYILDEDVHISQMEDGNYELDFPENETFWNVPFDNPSEPENMVPEGGGVGVRSASCPCTGSGSDCHIEHDPPGERFKCPPHKLTPCSILPCKPVIVGASGSGPSVVVRGLHVRINGVLYGI